MSGTPLYDAIVIGGGPAGSAVARLLAVRGHRVLVLARPRDRRRGLAESIPPSARKLLAAIDVLGAVEGAGTPPNRGNVVWWGDTARVEGFGGGDDEGFQVFRPDFDAVLLQESAGAGADVIIGAAARRVTFADEHTALVEFGTAGALRTARARFAVDCSGRTGVIGRAFRVYEPNHRMQAFIGLWRRSDGWLGGYADRTLLESYQDGWAWSMSVGPGVRQVAFMVDGGTTHTTRGPTMAHAYEAELAKTRHMRTLTRGAALDRAWACDASLYTSRVHAGSQFVLVGDAGSCIDPLSSCGVKKALASGWLAAVAVHTALLDPQRRGLAFEFFSSREREVYAAELARTREYAGRALAHHRHGFWEGRSHAAGAADLQGDETLLAGSAVREAYSRIRDVPTLRVGWSGHARFTTCGIVHNREIVEADALELAGRPRRFAGGVDLIELGRLATQHAHVPDLYSAYCTAHGRVALPALLGALSLLVAEGQLELLSERPASQPV